MKIHLAFAMAMLSCTSLFAAPRKVLARISQIEEAGDVTRLWLSDIGGEGTSYVPLGYGNFLSTPQKYLDIYPASQEVWNRLLSIALTAVTTERKVWLVWDDAGTNKSVSAMKME